MLRQAKQCSVRRLPLPQAFRAVWSGVTVQSWDTSQVERASNLVMELIASVPVLELSCTPDLCAVECLEQALKEVCAS